MASVCSRYLVAPAPTDVGTGKTTLERVEITMKKENNWFLKRFCLGHEAFVHGSLAGEIKLKLPLYPLP